MSTIITITTDEIGTGVHKRLRGAFPDAMIVIANQTYPSDVPDLNKVPGIVIVEELDKCSHPSYFIDRILNLKSHVNKEAL